MQRILLSLILVTYSTIGITASLERAEIFYQYGFVDKAKLELVEIIISSPQNAPNAYQMLGEIFFNDPTIAMDYPHLTPAFSLWKTLIEKYPDSPAATAIQTQYWPFIQAERKIDFYGIQSGMTRRDLVDKVHLTHRSCDTADHKKLSSFSSLHRDFCCQEGETFYAKDIGTFCSFFNKSGQVWKILFYKKVPDDPLQNEAIKQALEKMFPLFKIQTQKYVGKFYYQVTLIDDQMALAVLNQEKSRFLRLFKHQ